MDLLKSYENSLINIYKSLLSYSFDKFNFSQHTLDCIYKKKVSIKYS